MNEEPFQIKMNEDVLMPKSGRNSKVIFAALLSFLYFIFYYRGFFVLTAPSDPLQYVAPALFPKNGFPYFDRILLWLWIRLFSVLPFSPEKIGGLSTLSLTAGTLGLGFWWLAKKFDYFAASVFSFLYILSPWVLSYASYTYPSTLMTFVLLLTVLLMDMSSGRLKYLIGGFGFILALLSKIQAFPFILFLGVLIFLGNDDLKHKVKNVFWVSLGCLLASLLIFLIVTFMDGIEMWTALFSRYFLEDSAVQQFRGRSGGGIPAFHTYLLIPAVLLSFIGLILPLCIKKLKPVSSVSAVGLIQLIGLLLIYIITQRGGPLISNYWLDSHVFGLISIAGCVSILLKENNEYLFDKPFFTTATFVFCSLLSIPVLKIIKGNSVKYYLLSLSAVICITFFMSIKEKFSRRFRLITLVIFGFIVAVGQDSRTGILEANSKIVFSMPYHSISKRLLNITESGRYLVQTSINRPTISDGTTRLKNIYTAFYEQRDKKNDRKEFFWNEYQESYDYLISDNLDVLNAIVPYKYKSRTVYIVDVHSLKVSKL